MTVLVTGGAGYIGSHTVRALRDVGRDVVVLDSLELGRAEAVLGAPLVKGDIRDASVVQAVCRDHDVTAIVHFAAYKSVGESMQSPGKYWHNNVAGTAALVDAAMQAGVTDIVFSSSCSVYGTPGQVPVAESAPIAPESVYAESKVMVERVLMWYGVTAGLRSVSLRYFNAAGASRDAVLGEDWTFSINLIPLVMKAVLGAGPPVQVYGQDYPTPDGTCIRDYIHVEDLADAHVRALDVLADGLPDEQTAIAINLGTGVGSSVLEVIDATAAIAGRDVPHEIVGRRPGDPVATYADPTYAETTLGWRAKQGLPEIVETAFRWHSKRHMAASGPDDGRRPHRDLPTFPYGIEWSEPAASYATKVGIVLRTRDRPLLLPRAVASITEQTLEDWQLVIVNHGGDPAVVDRVLEDVGQDVRKRIEVVHLDAGGGMERASNVGLRLLDSQYVAVHDDDDTWLPEFLERTTAFLDDPANVRCGAVVTQILKRWERVTDTAIKFLDEELNSEDAFIDVQRLFGWNRFLPIGFLFRSALVDVIGPFNEHLDVIGDWDFHLRVAAVTDIGFIAEPLARYHLRDDRGDDRYDNTVTAGVERHLDTDARVRGALLRRFIDADPSRLGLLVALSHDDEMARRHTDRVEELVRLIDWRTHHTGNRINEMYDRLARMEAELDFVRADTARLRRALSIVGAPLRPLRKARLAWRRRRA